MQSMILIFFSVIFFPTYPLFLSLIPYLVHIQARVYECFQAGVDILIYPRVIRTESSPTYQVRKIIRSCHYWELPVHSNVSNKEHFAVQSSKTDIVVVSPVFYAVFLLQFIIKMVLNILESLLCM